MASRHGSGDKVWSFDQKKSESEKLLAVSLQLKKTLYMYFSNRGKKVTSISENSTAIFKIFEGVSTLSRVHLW
jgi:hypothetical protein